MQSSVKALGTAIGIVGVVIAVPVTLNEWSSYLSPQEVRTRQNEAAEFSRVDTTLQSLNSSVSELNEVLRSVDRNQAAIMQRLEDHGNRLRMLERQRQDD